MLFCEWNPYCAKQSTSGLAHLYPFSTKAFLGLDWSQCLSRNQFFLLRGTKNWPLARKTGLRVAPTPCWSRTKNCLCQGLGVRTVTYKTKQNSTVKSCCRLLSGQIHAAIVAWPAAELWPRVAGDTETFHL